MPSTRQGTVLTSKEADSPKHRILLISDDTSYLQVNSLDTVGWIRCSRLLFGCSLNSDKDLLSICSVLASSH